MNQKKKLSTSLHRFLGGTSRHVTLKLLALSFLVGIIMNFFGWTPRGLMHRIIKFFKSLWETGFITLADLYYLTMMGAIIVVPIFIILRILHKK
ncbi:DUF6460 domain-containing protein [Bartonella florencae]|uniref:DUF6460 domain-containing protein n=1 Tax=Bartonella florencae TaxID=928210 RepID=UPI000566BA3F|nr:DUF6460 domain-containing protein [Bartonella florencae]